VKFLVWQFNEGQLQNGPDAVGEWAAQGILPPQQWRAKIVESLQK